MALLFFHIQRAPYSTSSSLPTIYHNYEVTSECECECECDAGPGPDYLSGAGSQSVAEPRTSPLATHRLGKQTPVPVPPAEAIYMRAGLHHQPFHPHLQMPSILEPHSKTSREIVQRFSRRVTILERAKYPWENQGIHWKKKNLAVFAKESDQYFPVAA